MITKEQKQKTLSFCRSLELRFLHSNYTVTATPYFSQASDKLLIHVHKIVPSVSKTNAIIPREDHWHLKSPDFPIVFNGRKDKVKLVQQAVEELQNNLVEVFKAT